MGSYARFMSDVGWLPLSERLGVVPVSLSRPEEVPAALEGPLSEWVYDTLYEVLSESEPWAIGWTLVKRVSLRLNILLPHRVHDSDEVAREFAYRTDIGVLTDVVDVILDVMAASEGDHNSMKSMGEKRRAELRGLLDDARSALRVKADGRGLERRADVMAEAAFGEAVDSAEAASDAGSAAEHLRAAWGCVHALSPDPGKAYAEAIKAVEAAAHAVLEPERPKATLGTMLRKLRANRERFSLAIGGPDGRGDAGPLLESASLLWEGQSSRHGSSRPTRPETLDEARMAVHLAVMLVQWFTSGAVRCV